MGNSAAYTSLLPESGHSFMGLILAVYLNPYWLLLSSERVHFISGFGRRQGQDLRTGFLDDSSLRGVESDHPQVWGAGALLGATA